MTPKRVLFVVSAVAQLPEEKAVAFLQEKVLGADSGPFKIRVQQRNPHLFPNCVKFRPHLVVDISDEPNESVMLVRQLMAHKKTRRAMVCVMDGPMEIMADEYAGRDKVTDFKLVVFENRLLH